jgi:pimeloyl-ACP methyl ester carboxylesterase
METVTSRDGTSIAYDREGEGPAVILVAGALCARLSWSGPKLSRLLAQRLTVFNYDRRGRGDSGNTLPYSVEREIDDIEALVDSAGGEAFLYGHSSGASLALEAAARLGKKVSRLALYDAPYNDDPRARQGWNTYIKELGPLLDASRRGDAVALFMKFLGTPEKEIDGMRRAPMWPMLEAIAPTLAYDHTAILGRDASVPLARASAVKARTLVMNGGSSAPFMAETARALSSAIPGARLLALEGQRHDVGMEALAPVLAEFFSGLQAPPVDSLPRPSRSRD